MRIMQAEAIPAAFSTLCPAAAHRRYLIRGHGPISVAWLDEFDCGRLTQSKSLTISCIAHKHPATSGRRGINKAALKEAASLAWCAVYSDYAALSLSLRQLRLPDKPGTNFASSWKCRSTILSWSIATLPRTTAFTSFPARPLR
jgi:hypothetical protein